MMGKRLVRSELASGSKCLGSLRSVQLPVRKNASGSVGPQTFVPCRHCNGFPASGQLGGHTNPTTPFPRICTFSDPQHLRTYQVQTSKMKMKIEDDAVDAKGGTTLGRRGRHGCRGRHCAYRCQEQPTLCALRARNTSRRTQRLSVPSCSTRQKHLKNDPEIVSAATRTF